MRIERTAGRLIFGFPIGADEAWQLQKRYRRHCDKLFVCLHRDDVEPTKNSSERDLRNSVIHDKVTGGYRSRRGAEQGAVFATLLTTGRKLGQNAYQRLCSIAGPSPLHAGRPALPTRPVPPQQTRPRSEGHHPPRVMPYPAAGRLDSKQRYTRARSPKRGDRESRAW